MPKRLSLRLPFQRRRPLDIMQVLLSSALTGGRNLSGRRTSGKEV